MKRFFQWNEDQSDLYNMFKKKLSEDHINSSTFLKKIKKKHLLWMKFDNWILKILFEFTNTSSAIWKA